MDQHNIEEVLRNLDRRTTRIEQFLPMFTSEDSGESLAVEADAELDHLQDDLRRLAESLDAIDRRDAAQHGGIKGELAHVVRRIARLEAMPGLRHPR
jgi:hypothetical protein